MSNVIEETSKKIDAFVKDYVSDTDDATRRYANYVKAALRFIQTTTRAETLDNVHGDRGREYDALKEAFLKAKMGPDEIEKMLFAKHYVFLEGIGRASGTILRRSYDLLIYEITPGSKEGYERYQRNRPNVHGTDELKAWIDRWHGRQMANITLTSMDELQQVFDRWSVNYWHLKKKFAAESVFDAAETFELGCRAIIKKYDAKNVPTGETLKDAWGRLAA